MCKFKDTTLGIKKLDFNVKRGAMAAYLTDGREIIVPVSMFPDIKHLTKKQREEWMIMDDQYFSFEALSRIYSFKDVLTIDAAYHNVVDTCGTLFSCFAWHSK